MRDVEGTWHLALRTSSRRPRREGGIAPLRRICVARNFTLGQEPAVVPARVGLSFIGLKRP